MSKPFSAKSSTSAPSPVGSSSTPPPPPPPSASQLARPRPFAPPPALEFLTAWIPWTADPNYQVSAIAFLLGSVFSVSVILALPLLPSFARPVSAKWIHSIIDRADPAFATYLVSWSIFHMLEYQVTAIWNPSKVNVDSYLLNNGIHYHIAHAVGIIEYAISSTLSPSSPLNFLRRHPTIRLAGLTAVIGGQVVRSLAMIHASHSFSHHIAYKKKDDHVLVKTGIYSYSRHPSYAGFFWWAVGTQVLLGNVLSTVAFALFLWRWFFRRIGEEERLLVRFFGDEYVNYREDVVSGLPLLR